MNKISKIQHFWNAHEAMLQEQYPGVRLGYLEEVFETSGLSFDHFQIEIQKGTPLDYISKTRNFVGLDFYVDSRVLIPRFETELLYELALTEIQKNKKNRENDFQFCEVGVGSGCLGLSLLASELNQKIAFHATDISNDAMEVFRINQKLFKEQLEKHEIKTYLGDRLEPVIKAMPESVFDLIISNPPYIKTIGDKELVHKTTLKHEPHIALFIDDINYDTWFNDFFEQVFYCLKPDAYFMMEGHEDHLQKQAQIERENEKRNWSQVEVKQDLTRRDRFLILKK